MKMYKTDNITKSNNNNSKWNPLILNEYWAEFFLFCTSLNFNVKCSYMSWNGKQIITKVVDGRLVNDCLKNA